MKSFIAKLKSSFGQKEVSKTPDETSFTEAIMNDVDGNPFAISETNVLYAGLSELAGYHYFKTIVIGTFQIKTFQGAQLIIHGTDFVLTLNSDMEELESEISRMPNRHVSRIDFEIEQADIEKIGKSNIESIEIIAKKNHVKFSIIEGHFDKELAEQETSDNPEQEVRENANPSTEED